MTQVLKRIAAVEKGRFQYGMSGERSFHAAGINPTSGLLHQIFVAADVVRIGMGVDDGVKRPLLPFQNLAHLASGILIIAAVNQTDFLIINEIHTYFDRTVNIETSGTGLNQFIHGISLPFTI